MKIVKTFLTIIIISMLMVVNANAWGKKEQGILIGAGSALFLSSFLNSGSNDRGYYRGYYNDRSYYNRYYVEPTVQYVKPQITYVEQPKKVVISNPGMSHRQQKDHIYINKINPSDTVVIEYSDGTKTIIQGR